MKDLESIPEGLDVPPRGVHSIRGMLGLTMAGLLVGCIQRTVNATDLTPATQPGIVIESMRFKETTWDPVVGPVVEGWVVVSAPVHACGAPPVTVGTARPITQDTTGKLCDASSEKLDQEVVCQGRPHQQQLIVWSQTAIADLARGQSVELWFWGQPTRGGLLDITCRVQRAAGTDVPARG